MSSLFEKDTKGTEKWIWNQRYTRQKLIHMLI